MPRQDPIPRARKADYERAALAWERYKRMARWLVLLAVATIGLTLVYWRRSGAPMPLHFAIAALAGVGLVIMIGTGLIALTLLGNRSGHDAGATDGETNDDGRG